MIKITIISYRKITILFVLHVLLQSFIFKTTKVKYLIEIFDESITINEWLVSCKFVANKNSA